MQKDSKTEGGNSILKGAAHKHVSRDNILHLFFKISDAVHYHPKKKKKTK